MAMQNAFFGGKLDAARELHYQCMPMFKGLFIAPNPTCLKYVLAKMGLCTENLRLPLVPLDSKQRETMDELIKTYKLNQSLQLT
jgi:4-hydroxy-tetrahydrodipicolinate synthase